MPRDHLIYLAEFFRAAVDKIEAMDEGKVDREYMETPEFHSDVRRVVDALGSERNRQKQSAFVAAMAHGALTDRPQEVERLRFLDILELIRPSHLRLLAVVVASEHRREGGSFDDYVRRHMPNQDLENVRLDWTDLMNLGLLSAIPSAVATITRSEQVWHAFPAIGRRFAAFVEAGSTETPPDP